MIPWITSVYLSVFFYIEPDDHDALDHFSLSICVFYIKPDDHDTLDQFSVSISVFLHKTW